MAGKKEKSGNKADDQSKKSNATVEAYEKLIARLKKERKELKEEIDRDYREARRYVRSHPEESVLYSVLGGVAIGFILGKISSK